MIQKEDSPLARIFLPLSVTTSERANCWLPEKKPSRKLEESTPARSGGRLLLRKANPSLCAFPVLLLMMVATLLLANARAQTVVEQVAATVEGEPVTFSDLLRVAAFREESPPSSESERRDFYLDLLNQLIDRKLISMEARETPFIQVTESDITAFIDSYRRRFQSETEYRQYLHTMAMDETDFRDLVKERLLVNQFVQLRFEPFIIVLPDDIEQYYQQQFLPEVESTNQVVPPLELVEETIRQILIVERTNEELDKWIRNTRRKSRIEILLYRKPEIGPNLPADMRQDTELIDIKPEPGGRQRR